MGAPGNDPAFPNPEMGREHFDKASAYPGMSLRQFYKAHILQGIMSNADYLKVVGESSQKHETTKTLAMHAAELADAMLAEDEEFDRKSRS